MIGRSGVLLARHASRQTWQQCLLSIRLGWNSTPQPMHARGG
jgi:hypothetical protein